MPERSRVRLDLGLIHHPVVNRQGGIIGSAVTNLDIHDIARAGRTFGVRRYYIVTPYEDQQSLVQELLNHWLVGHGGVKNKDRKEALSMVHIMGSLEKLLIDVREKWGEDPLVLATCAKKRDNTLSYQEARQIICSGRPCLLLFGTASGLAPEVFECVEKTLPPIVGSEAYNHLSVRSAVAIILDRLLGV